MQRNIYNIIQSRTGLEKIVHLFNKIHSFIFTFFFSKSFRTFGKGSRIVSPIRFANLHRISIGENVFIAQDCWIHVIDEHNDSMEPEINIGNFTGIGMNSTLTAACKIILEDHVLLARNVFISDHSHRYQDISLPIMLQGYDHIAPVTIGAGSWLGQNTVVLPGANIGKHCIIGANSVVTRPIPDYSVAAGSPARVIKKYDSDSGKWIRVLNR